VTLTLDLTPEMAEKLQAEAVRRGIPAEQIVHSALKSELVRDDCLESANNDEEWERTLNRSDDIESNSNLADSHEPLDEEDTAFQAFLDECAKTKTPFIPDEFLRREYIYEDRGAEPCSETRI
jgi:hypothetical protein